MAISLELDDYEAKELADYLAGTDMHLSIGDRLSLARRIYIELKGSNVTHFMNVCEFGQIHGQCRCASPNKEQRRVLCPTPDKHRPHAETDSTVTPLHDRLEATVKSFLGGMAMPVIVRALTDQLENVVKQWLAEELAKDE